MTKAFREHTLKKRIWLLSAAFLRKNMERLRRRWKSGRQGTGFGRGKTGSDGISGLDCVSDKYALLAASPLTGRTHQIRAHLEFIGTPILGDGKYFGTEREKAECLSINCICMPIK